MATGLRSTVGGGLQNSATAENATVGGGRSNVVSALYGTISGGGERITGDATTSNKVLDDYGTVGGGGDNQAGSDDADPLSAIYATVGGGVINLATGSHTTVGGGQQNTASAAHGTIGGGILNLVTDELGTVGGGRQNQAGDDEGTAIDAGEATVGGGFGNIASGLASTVAGGRSNTASGDFASVPGGELNAAAGDRSFAAGRQAKANFNGMFVWADSNAAQDFPSATEPTFTPANDQFLVRARGGAVFVTNYNNATGDSTASVQFSQAGDIQATGTITSGSSITIDGTASTINSTGDLDLQTAGTSRVYLDNTTGNVGIGTETPAAKLEVVGSDDVFSVGNTNSWFKVFTAGNSRLSLGDGNGNEAGFISSAQIGEGENILNIAACDDLGNCPTFTTFHGNGNVGIGTTSPTFLLEVNGSAGKPGGGSWSS